MRAMIIRIFLIALLALSFALPVTTGNAFASEKKEEKKSESKEEEEAAPVGYGGAKVQMSPFMVPYRASDGIRYEPVMVRLVLDAGPKERSACFSVPYVHDRFLAYFYKANLTMADFVGERRQLMAKNLFQVAIDTVGKGYYSDVEVIDTDAPPLDPKSQTLSAQCK